MKSRMEALVAKAKSASELAESLAKEGMTSVEGACKGVGLFRSLSALSVSDLEKDETHYLLIPFPAGCDGESEFVLFSKRVIPEGYGATNSLPKERVFHLPDLSAEERMQEQLTSSFVAENSRDGGGGVMTLADRLEALAEDLDRETDKVSGGILLVGGLTTLINPVAGIGMMASGVLPKWGGRLAKSGASLAGDQLRDWSQKRQLQKVEKAAASEMARFKPQIFINPVLKKLEMILTNSSGEEDPLLDELDLGKEFPNHRYLMVTGEGIGEVYEQILNQRKSPLKAPVKAWLQSLAELT